MAVKKYFVNSAKPGYPYDRNAKKYFSWGYDIWIDGSRQQERGFLNKSDCEQAVENLKRSSKLGRHGITTPERIPFLIDLFQKKLNNIDSVHDRTRAKRVFEYFLGLVPQKFKVDQLRTTHLQKFVDARSQDGVSPQTIHRELVPIVAALKNAYKYFAVLDDYVPPRIPRPRVVKAKKERVIYKHEQDGLFNYFFSPPFKNEIRQEPKTRRRTGQFLMMLLLTLSRPGELAALKKTHIDLDDCVIEITGRKSRYTATQTVRRLMITPTMRAILEERMQLTKTEYLFTRSGAVTPDMYESFKAACEANGIIYSRTDPVGISFHTARHTGITMLVQNGIDIKTVGQLAGQSDQGMTLYYTHPDQKLVSQAGQILEAKMGRSAGDLL